VTDPKDWKGASLTHQIHQVDMSQSVYFALSNRLAPMQPKSKGTSRQREKHDFRFRFLFLLSIPQIILLLSLFPVFLFFPYANPSLHLSSDPLPCPSSHASELWKRS
jgi:hypothetical protein